MAPTTNREVVMIRKVILLTAVACVALMSVAQSALAVQDYGDLTSGFSAELGAAVPVALIAVGLFVGVVLAYKVIRRLLRA
jgi:hypothetical protein